METSPPRSPGGAGAEGNPPSDALDRLTRRLQDPSLADVDVHSAPGDASTPGTPRLVPSALMRMQSHVVLAPLGRGGMGAVYLAHPRALPDRMVALKILPALFAADAARLHRFATEALTASRIEHRNVVRVLDVGEEAGIHYQIQELVPDGRTLADRIREARDARTLPKDWYREVASLFAQVAAGMAAVHGANVLHRDLKPSNILLLPDGTPKVADFGLAKDLEAGSGMTGAGSPGTLNYKSPEQVDRKYGIVDERSDVFALGATLYEALMLNRLFPGDEPSEVHHQILHREVEDLRLQRPSVPTDLSVICRKCLEKEPSRRYQTMTELAADLDRHLRHEPIAAKPAGRLERARKWVRRNPTVSATLGSVCAGAVVATVLAFQNAQLAGAEKAAKEQAQLNVQRALASEQVAAQRAEDVLSLSVARELNDLVAEADRLWPARPELVPQLEAWLERARAVVEGGPAASLQGARLRSLAEHRAKLTELRSRARERDGEELASARAAHPLSAEVESNRKLAQDLAKKAADPALPPWLVKHSRQFQQRLEGRVAAHAGAVDAEVRWVFSDPRERWWHDQLARLVRGLDDFAEADQGLVGSGAEPTRGWGMQRRLDYARSVWARCRDSAEAQAGWAEAAAAAAKTPGLTDLTLRPQLDLLPLGPDPASGLWEFAHLPSGEPPRRGADGKLVLTDESAIVLVLVPGGTFPMGAQPTDRDKPNYDPYAQPGLLEPVQDITLAPFFLGKHEITQGQWVRMTGNNPSQYPIGVGLEHSDWVTGRHPVEKVDWMNCMKWLPRFGLQLPTEAQWERAARAGTTTPWCHGATPQDLAEAANLADQTVKSNGGPPNWVYDDWLNDGRVVHAPVGSFRPNPFGLHDLYGNVAEWCLDRHGPLSVPVRAGDGLRQPESTYAVYRGGGFFDPAVRSRSAERNGNAVDLKTHSLGVRAARAVDP